MVGNLQLRRADCVSFYAILYKGLEHLQMGIHGGGAWTGVPEPILHGFREMTEFWGSQKVRTDL